MISVFLSGLRYLNASALDINLGTLLPVTLKLTNGTQNVQFISVLHGHLDLGFNMAWYQTTVDSGSTDSVRRIPILLGFSPITDLLSFDE
jgi:hypothetical protein